MVRVLAVLVVLMFARSEFDDVPTIPPKRAKLAERASATPTPRLNDPEPRRKAMRSAFVRQPANPHN